MRKLGFLVSKQEQAAKYPRLSVEKHSFIATGDVSTLTSALSHWQ